MLKSRKLTMALFVFYLAVLAWVILWKSHFAFRFMGLQFTFVDPNPQRSLNLIPFGGMLVLGGQPDYNEILLNALVFVPYGVFLGALAGKRDITRADHGEAEPRGQAGGLRRGEAQRRRSRRWAAHWVLPILLTSLLFEALQYAFLLGASDITDVLANTAGGLLGLGLYWLCRKVCGEKTAPVVNTLALTMVAGFVLVMSQVRPL